MNKLLMGKLGTYLLVAFFFAHNAHADEVYGRVSVLHSPDSRPCTFFQLDHKDIWYGMKTDERSYKESLAFLLTSLTLDKPVSINFAVNGGGCGHHQAFRVMLGK